MFLSIDRNLRGRPRSGTSATTTVPPAADETDDDSAITAIVPPGVTTVDPPASESAAVTAQTCAVYSDMESRIDSVMTNSSAASADELRSLASDLSAAAAGMPPSAVGAYMTNGATFATIAADELARDPEAARNARVLMVDNLLAPKFTCIFAN